METLLIENELDVLMEGIENLDLTMIKLKLQDEEEGEGWTVEECNILEKEYQKFLALKRHYPDSDIVPNKHLDIFWHQHILDTEKYATDCQNIFGYFLHHYPYFGMRDEQDKQDLQDAFEETKRLYKLHFGEDYLGMSTRCKAPKCRTQCKPMKCK